MHLRARLTVLSFAAVLMAASAAVAQPRWSDKTTFTFDGPVEVPGTTLAPGTYVFELADSLVNRQTVQIWNADHTKLIATTVAIPAKRLDTSSDVVVRFRRTDGGTPAIKGWYYPGQRIGHEFVYPEEQARHIARGGKTLVLSSDEANAKTGADPDFFQVDENGKRAEMNAPALPPNVKPAPAAASTHDQSSQQR